MSEEKKTFKVKWWQHVPVSAEVEADTEEEAIAKAKEGDWLSVTEDEAGAENDYFEVVKE